VCEELKSSLYLKKNTIDCVL